MTLQNTPKTLDDIYLAAFDAFVVGHEEVPPWLKMKMLADFVAGLAYKYKLDLDAFHKDVVQGYAVCAQLEAQGAELSFKPVQGH